jgi:tRNA(adenine34) deaminase
MSPVPNSGKTVNRFRDDRDVMRRAMEIARSASAQNGGVPIGCVIVRDGEIVGEGANEVEQRSDPTAHAEIVAIRRAAERIGPDLRGATLYSTLQPCGMCTMALIWAHVGRVVYGAERHQVHEMYFEDRHLDIEDFIRDAFRDDMVLEGGVLADEVVTLYHRPGEDVAEEEVGNV